ncbi:MAG: HypC/HybG/HupF family hydrogenase formation chaperone [Myxococcaceae bacterium]|jgi:hydrogenase expression/formation protein HypC|nr:HypC/HybG/HupF family hydrogenase formation chaperone [Myxococcaceae bacterium]
MCLGLPMKVLSGDDVSALVERGTTQRRVSTLLTGAVPVGAYVLVHLDSAVRVLDADDAVLIDLAISGLEAAARGESHEAYFADLIHREPRLPPHLVPKEPT